MAALWKGGAKARHLQGGWQATETGRPIYQHRGRKGGRILVYPHGAPSATAPLPTPEALWELIAQLNPFTADVALAVLAQLCEPSVGRKPQAPFLEPVRITADAILQYKGIRRWGGERRLLHERVFEEMERLRSLHFDVDKYPERHPTTGKWDPQGISWQGDRLFDIVKVDLYQQSLFGDREHIAVSWSVRAGQWAHWWLNAQGRVWVGRMARILLEFDHREQRGAAVMAKKIGQRLVLLGDILPVGTPITRRIDHILEDIGELPTPDQRPRNWLGRTRNRVEAGLDLLQEAGVCAVGWPEGYSSIPNRRWLETKIQLTVPETLPALPPPVPEVLPVPRATPTRRLQRRPKMQTPIDGTTIRQIRLERHWSQRALAKHLGITRPYLAQIENGVRSPSSLLAAKVQAWLNASQDE
jgi:DNA-binding XRE family transcriptional regulator